MKKTLNIICAILLAIFIAIGGFIAFWFLGDNYDDFYKKTKKAFFIDGVKEGFCSQGLSYDSNTKTFLTSGFMASKGVSSRIYLINEKNGLSKYINIKENGQFYCGHAGGVATDGISIWVASDNDIYEVDFLQALNCKRGGSIDIKSHIKLGHKTDFIFVENGHLWIGEFDNGTNYKITSKHHITTQDGSLNKALTFCYDIDHSKNGGFDKKSLSKILSTPSLVQGMAIQNNKVIISTSYSLPDSHIYIHDNVFSDTKNTFKFENQEIPLYILDKQNQTYDLRAPSMSEEVVIVNNRAYVIFENNCKKYHLFTREHLHHTYSFDINLK